MPASYEPKDIKARLRRCEQLVEKGSHYDFQQDIWEDARSRIENLEAAIRSILKEPHGCVFCDSGKLRNPAKPHDTECGFAMASRSVGE